MKKVFSSSSEVIHLWAQQNQVEARCSNAYFEGAVVYSYGRHYPLGIIVENKKGERAAIINASGYSATTSKHIAAFTTGQRRTILEERAYQVRM